MLKYAETRHPILMDDQAFRDVADSALDDLYRRLNIAGEQHDFEADFQAGALVIEFEDPPAKFVVSPNAPVRQIWLSANVRSYKLDWVAAKDQFMLEGKTLAEVVGDAIAQHSGEAVTL
jgi:CyaY protein